MLYLPGVSRDEKLFKISGLSLVYFIESNFGAFLLSVFYLLIRLNCIDEVCAMRVKHIVINNMIFI